MALFSNKKLKVILIKNPIVQGVFLKLSDSFKQVVKLTSNRPAIININQFIANWFSSCKATSLIKVGRVGVVNVLVKRYCLNSKRSISPWSQSTDIG